MQRILSAMMVVFLSLVSSQVEANEIRPWAGPAIELRHGRILTEHKFGSVTDGQSMYFGFDDAATVSGLKVGWRFPLGDRLTFGPMLAYYGEGVSDATSGVYAPEGASVRASYRETRAVTAGFQLGVDVGNGWFAYGEAGYVCQEVVLSGEVSVPTLEMSVSQTGYEVGPYAELGVAKALGPHAYVAGALQGRRYQHAEGMMTADRRDVSLWAGVGLRW